MQGERELDIVKTVTQKGSGLVVAPRSVVSIHYEARGKERNVISSNRRNPFIFQLGRGDALECIEHVVRTMQVGETAELAVRGRYKAEVEEVSGLEADDAINMTIELLAATAPRVDITNADAVVTEATLLKQDGNEFFKSKAYEQAIECYHAALQVLEAHALDEQSPKSELLQLRIDALNNLSLCCLNINSPATALFHCNEVLRIAPNDRKALTRRGRTYLALHDYASARHDFSLALELSDGNDKAALELQRQLKLVGTAERKERKRECLNFGRAFSMVGVTLPTNDRRDPSLAGA